MRLLINIKVEEATKDTRVRKTIRLNLEKIATRLKVRKYVLTCYVRYNTKIIIETCPHFTVCVLGLVYFVTSLICSGTEHGPLQMYSRRRFDHLFLIGVLPKRIF